MIWKILCKEKAATFDKDGDAHYDLLSALQKSIRGSDVNASLHYAARLIEEGFTKPSTSFDCHGL